MITSTYELIQRGLIAIVKQIAAMCVFALKEFRALQAADELSALTT